MNAISVMRPDVTDMSVEAAQPAVRGDRNEGLHREPKFGGGVKEGVPHEGKTTYIYIYIYIYIYVCVCACVRVYKYVTSSSL